MDALEAEAASALSRSDAARAREVIANLEGLRDDLALTYNLVIVQRGQSAVETTPDVNPNVRNYYLIVEAVTPSGQRLKLPITSEEDGAVRTVSAWGLRVDPQVFERVKQDKMDDGIVNNKVVGKKQRGYLTPDYTVATTGAAITEW